MASAVYTNAFCQVNAKDLSSYGVTATINRGSETLDVTTFGNTTRINKGGLLTWSVDLDFLYDNSTAGPEAVLWALVGTTSCVEIREINACSSANNPIYSGIVVLSQLNQGGAIGSMLKASCKLMAASALSRASSS